MQLSHRLKNLRQQLNISQEAIGAVGFISTPGWIKLENGQRQPSEKLIEQLVKYLIDEKVSKRAEGPALRVELLTLKYMGSNSPFVRELARSNAASLPNADELLRDIPVEKPRRGRPAKRTE